MGRGGWGGGRGFGVCKRSCIKWELQLKLYLLCYTPILIPPLPLPPNHKKTPSQLCMYVSILEVAKIFFLEIMFILVYVNFRSHLFFFLT